MLIELFLFLFSDYQLISVEIYQLQTSFFDYQNDWVAQQYLPNNLLHANYFAPKGNSKIEARYKATYQKLKQMQSDNLRNNH